MKGGKDEDKLNNLPIDNKEEVLLFLKQSHKTIKPFTTSKCLREKDESDEDLDFIGLSSKISLHNIHNLK